MTKNNDPNQRIKELESHVQLLLNRVEGRARQQHSYYEKLGKKADNVRHKLATGKVSSIDRERLEGYLDGLIEGMVYLNDDLRCGTMPDGEKYDKELDEERFLK